MPKNTTSITIIVALEGTDYEKQNILKNISTNAPRK